MLFHHIYVKFSTWLPKKWEKNENYFYDIFPKPFKIKKNSSIYEIKKMCRKTNIKQKMFKGKKKKENTYGKLNPFPSWDSQKIQETYTAKIKEK